MRKILALPLLGASATAYAANDRSVVELKDGGKLVIDQKGAMVHTDGAGNRVRMMDRVVMQTRDGGKIMMKNDAIWKQITEHGTLKPGHSY
jgi:hypothetical protein